MSDKTAEYIRLLECSQRALRLRFADQSMLVLLVELGLSNVIRMGFLAPVLM